MSVDAAVQNRALALYQTYGVPLEKEHWGEFVAISPDGDVILGTSWRDVLTQAKAQFGPGNFVFKVGERVVGKWR